MSHAFLAPSRRRWRRRGLLSREPLVQGEKGRTLVFLERGGDYGLNHRRGFAPLRSPPSGSPVIEVAAGDTTVRSTRSTPSTVYSIFVNDRLQPPLPYPKICSGGSEALGRQVLKRAPSLMSRIHA